MNYKKIVSYALFLVLLSTVACTDLTGVDPEAPADIAGSRDDLPEVLPFPVFGTAGHEDNPAGFSATIMHQSVASLTVRLRARVGDDSRYDCRRLLPFGPPETVGRFEGASAGLAAELAAVTDRVALTGAPAWVEYWLEDSDGRVASPRIRIPLPGSRPVP